MKLLKSAKSQNLKGKHISHYETNDRQYGRIHNVLEIKTKNELRDNCQRRGKQTSWFNQAKNQYHENHKMFENLMLSKDFSVDT